MMRKWTRLLSIPPMTGTATGFITSAPLPALRGSGIFPPMSTLAESEQAADALTPERKQALSSRSASLHCQP